VLAPLDDIALRTPVTNAKQAGIPVVIIDSDFEGRRVYQFRRDRNYLGGKIAARRMIELLKGKGKVAVLRYGRGFRKHRKAGAGFS